jgi:hypothetical protein
MADKNIENKLRERLANYKETPNLASWSKIEAGLPQPRLIKWPLAAVILLLLISTGILIPYFWNTTEFLVATTEHAQPPNHLKPSESEEASISCMDDANAASKNECQNSIDVKEKLVVEDDGQHMVNNPDSRQVFNNEEVPFEINVSGLARVTSKESLIEKQNDLKASDAKFNFQDLKILKSIGYKFEEYQSGILAIEGVEVTENNNPTRTKSDKKKKTYEERRFTYYMQGMPTLNYNRIETNSNDDQLIASVEKISAISTDRMGIRLESGFLYTLNDRFDLFGSMLYLKQNQKINYTVNVVDDFTSTNDGEKILINPIYTQEQDEYEYKLENLGVQLGFIYKFKSEKFNTSLGAGMEFHKSLGRNTNDFFEQPDLYVFYNLFYRIEYPKNKRFRVMAQPTFNYSINLSENLDAPFYINPYGLGLHFGFTFKI